MIANKKVLAIIPARGGSKGIPRKNILPLQDIPLIAWTIRAAKKSQYIDRLILSSEDPEIIEVAKKWGCEVPFVRPQALAKDETTGMEVVLHAIKNASADYDLIVLLQPTSPFRSTADIDACIETCQSRNACACVTVSKMEKHPLWMYYLQADNTMTPVMAGQDMPQRRQDLPPAFVLNGAVYVGEKEFLLQNKSFFHEATVAYVMPADRSIDIDNKFDLEMAKVIAHHAL